MKEVDGIKILEDIELEGIVGGATKKKVTAKKKVAQHNGPGGPPELI